MSDEEAGYVLAFDLKDHAIKAMEQPDGAVLLYACCWLLADLTLQAHVVKGHPVEEALACILTKLETCVAQLLLHAQVDEAPVVSAVKH